MVHRRLLGVMVFIAGCFQPPTEVVPCAADGSCGAGFVCSATRVCVPAIDAGVNPCVTGNGGCDALTTCTNSSGTPSCSACPSGYTGNGATGCFDVNECASANGGCSTDATCANTAGGHTCACKEGYVGDGVTCLDVDECASSASGCSPEATCTNSAGGRTCTCRSGYVGDGLTCLDVNECATDNGACDALTTCTNTPGGRTCGACPAGYSGTGATGCGDIDECLTGNGGCDALTTCTNMPGSRACGACPAGYLGTGETACRWNDPSLTGLTVTPGTLAFSPTTLLYVLEVPQGTSSVLVVPTVALPSGVQLTINGQTVSPGASRSVSLSGTTTIDVAAVATSGAQLTYTVVVFQGTAQQVYAKASNTGYSLAFGRAMAISADGTTLAVGAREEASGATGIGGNQTNYLAPSSGAVYVFARTGATWMQQAYVKASNTGATDRFGTALSLSADGNLLAVGAYGEDSGATGVGGSQTDEGTGSSGAVYLFSRAGSAWSQQAYVKASNTGINDLFGASVALSADGSTLAVAAVYEDSGASGVGGNQADNSVSNAGAVYVFTRGSTTWSQQAYLKAPTPDVGEFFGSSLALSATGDTLAVGTPGDGDISTPGCGAVSVFARVGTSWSQQVWLKASNADTDDRFGTSVSLSGDGNTLAVGAPFERSSATGIGGDQADNSGAANGAVYLFVRSATSWSQATYVKPSNVGGGFGYSISLAADASALLVGAFYEGSASTGVGGNQAVAAVGYSGGAGYLFVHEAGAWLQLAYVKASNTGYGDSFGLAAALSGDGHTLAVSAPFERSNATGLGGNQADNSLVEAGAVYVFTR